MPQKPLSRRAKEAELQDRRNWNLETEWTPDRLDRIREYYFEGTALSEEDAAYHRLLVQVQAMVIEDSLSRTQIIKKLQAKDGPFKISASRSYRVYDDALALFGDTHKSSQVAMRAMMTERLMRLAQIAEEKGDVELAAKIYRDISKMNGVEKAEDGGAVSNGMQVVIYSRDPQVLRQQEGGEA
mgnify:CR=1 FL=1